MRRFLVAFVMAAIAAIGFGSVSASASNGAVTPFKTQYNGTETSVWTCAGVHVANKAGSLDIETCRITGDTSPYVAGSFRSGQICPPGNPDSIVGTPACGELPPYSTPELSAYWLSDFNGSIATSWKVVMIKHRDGTFTAFIVAHFSS